MRDAVIVGAVRTPVGRRKGSLAEVHPVDLSAHVLRALAERTGLDPAVVDDVIWGCVSQVGEQSWNVGRNAVLAAGWPESVPGTTLDRQCGSSQQAAALRRRRGDRRPGRPGGRRWRRVDDPGADGLQRRRRHSATARSVRERYRGCAASPRRSRSRSTRASAPR